jgi:hypothetical protein
VPGSAPATPWGLVPARIRGLLCFPAVGKRELWVGGRRVVMMAALLCLGPVAGHPQTAEGSAASPGGSETAERPGLIRVGTWYLTPYIRIGSLGVDSNVFYTATDRQVDFTVSGGPGLEIVRPFGEKSRFRLDGGVNYLWFARTESQRKLTGYGSALLELEGLKTRFLAEEAYDQTFSRPSYEVDTRVFSETEATQALFRRNLGERLRMELYGSRRRTTTEDQEYLGTNLGNTLTENQYAANGELQIALSVKTSLVGGGEQQWYRFPRLPERDGRSTLAYGGFRTDPSALVSGRALSGYRWFRLDRSSSVDRGIVYADVDATWNLSPKTKLLGRYLRDLDYTAFTTTGPTPTVVIERVEVTLDKVLANNIYLRLLGRQQRLTSDGEVVLVIPDEGLTRDTRDDRLREAGAEIGYQFRSRVRIGVSAIYTERRSNIQTFGIQGLLAGFKVEYNPPQPTFR